MTIPTRNGSPPERPSATPCPPADTAEPHGGPQEELSLPVARHEPLPPIEATESG
jgi:hypothetical protein